MENNLAKELFEIFKKHQVTLSSAESLTAGLFAATVASTPGASQFLQGGVVTYSNEEKVKVLGVDPELINKYGVVSEQVAYDMAKKCQKLFGTSLAVSFTGNAGPDALEGKPVGLVYIGFAYQDKIFVKECRFIGKRNEIRELCVNFAFEQLISFFNANY